MAGWGCHTGLYKQSPPLWPQKPVLGAVDGRRQELWKMCKDVSGVTAISDPPRVAAACRKEWINEGD